LDKYAGAYKDEMLRRRKGCGPKRQAGAYDTRLVGDLDHWNYDTFQVTWRERSLGKAL